jgi:hypothetical protein
MPKREINSLKEGLQPKKAVLAWVYIIANQLSTVMMVHFKYKAMAPALVLLQQ